MTVEYVRSAVFAHCNAITLETAQNIYYQSYYYSLIGHRTSSFDWFHSLYLEPLKGHTKDEKLAELGVEVHGTYAVVFSA